MAKKITTEEFKRRLSENKPDYELIGEYNTKRLKILHKVCGNIWEVLPSNALKRNCGHCRFKNKSSLSSKFEQLLIKNKICFKTEMTFPDCKDIRKLPFDYCIFDCENNILFLVEIDGMQHFFETGYSKGGLSEVQRRDSIKNNYCATNNILLFRISYQEENKIEDIFNNIFKTVNGCCHREYVGYTSKSIITEELAEIIRELYIKDKASIKSVSKILNISESTITKVIYYEYFPNVRLDLKEFILNKAESLKRKNRFFTELTKEEREEIINLKKQGVTDTEIAKKYRLHRKSFRQYFENWDNLFEKSGNKRTVIHIESGKIFESLVSACKFFDYKYANELANLLNNSKIRKFNYFKCI